MSYPGIMKGETLLGFAIGTERVSSSHLSHLPLSSSHDQGTPQHFHLGGSGTGLRTSRSFDSTRRFCSFFLHPTQKDPPSRLFGPLKTCTSHFCATVLISFMDYCSSTSSSSRLLSSACILEQSIKALSVILLTSFCSFSHCAFLTCHSTYVILG